MIITVTMNPAIDKTAVVDELVVGGLNRLEQTMMNAGGKGINVSKTIQALGGESLATGFIAGTNGAFIKESLDQLSIDNDMVEVAGNTRVNLKVLNKDMDLTELNEEGPYIDEVALRALVDKIVKHASKNDYVVLSGSVPGSVPKDIYAKLIKQLKQNKIKVILDADGDLFAHAIEEVPNVIKPNKYELCKYYEISEDCKNDEIVKLGKALLDKGMQLIAISMGKEGALFIDSEHTAMVKGLKVDAHSSVGAGDAMVAAIAYGLEQELSFEELVKLAVATSAGAVMTKGTQPASKEQVKELMKEVEINYL
ncbi:1-phosphofructokinase [Breznakia pachnodae]|uniref:Tagatose-6-phosphate kinase n=1 Tax=Breznakia pachnodae TaxID=265178 RepID=A0ABU0DXF8_9FIRM|nr:1-phosphofructokinase [Breznakia pachnodae]MDQ0359323.1 1-phosphofructokinase [Breznakia pachnodae]